MKKSKIVTLLIILALIVVGGYSIYDGYNYAPSRLRVNYKSIEDEKINKSLNNLQIAFISDLHYLSYFNDERLNQLVNTLNNANPDIVIFIGDLVDRSMNEEEYEKLLTSLKSINSKYGKFAVLGEADYASEEINQQVESLLFDSEFEILKNKMIKLSKDTQDAIQLVGIDSPSDNLANIEEAYKDIDENLYTITVVHTPDTSDDISANSTDLIVAGHSHGGQIKIPLLGQVYNKPLAEYYYSGIYNMDNKKLHVINGVGTTVDDVRINAPAEIVIYTLKNKASLVK